MTVYTYTDKFSLIYILIPVIFLYAVDKQFYKCIPTLLILWNTVIMRGNILC